MVLQGLLFSDSLDAMMGYVLDHVRSVAIVALRKDFRKRSLAMKQRVRLREAPNAGRIVLETYGVFPMFVIAPN